MSVHIVFEKAADNSIKRLIQALTGTHVHTELVVTTTSPDPPYITRTAYTAYVKENFSSTPEHEFPYSDDTHDFLQIYASNDEIDLIKNTCDTRVRVPTPYNYKDMILSIVPLRNPVEKDIFNAKTLFCSQAVVLILRSCLDPTHPVVHSLKNFNSRTINPEQLFAALKPVCQPATLEAVCKKKTQYRKI
jgi:hypothetical protein